jgi:predicted ferric reductase
VTSPALWYAARAGGIVAWALAAASVVWGLALSTHVLGTNPRPAWLYDLHRFLGGLALVFTGVHVLAVLFDQYVHFGVVDVLIPFTGSWHPAAVAWGIVGLYLLLAVELTSLLRSRISKRLWRRTHYASFALFAATTVHAVTAGTDGTALILLAAVAASCVVVTLLAAVRIARSGSAPPSRPAPAIVIPGRPDAAEREVLAERGGR